MPTRKGAIYKICAAGLSAAAVVAKGTGVAAGITAFLEVGSKLVDIGGVTAEAQQADLQGILTQHVDRVETALADWFDHEFGGTRSQRRDAEAALVAMDAILSDCLPSPVQITSADLDPKKIAAIVADAMGQRDSSFAVPPVAGELTVQRRVALQLVEMAFRNALGRVEVFDKLAPAVHTEQLVLLRDIKRTVDALSKLAVPTAAPLETAATNRPEQFATNELERMARQRGDVYNRLRSRLSGRSGGDLEIQRLRTEAFRLIAEARFQEALAKYEEAVQRDLTAIEAGRDPVRRTQSLIETLVARANAARLAGDYHTASNDFAEAERLLPAEDVERRWRLTTDRAEALVEQGQLGDPSALREAVDAYRAALLLAPREVSTARWGATQAGLALVLFMLGQREGGNKKLLSQAVEASRAALLELTEADDPFIWSETQNNLGVALVRLGEQEEGSARLEQAVEAFRAVLRQRTRERDPLFWAATMENLGAAISVLAEYKRNAELTLEAVDAYRQSAEERKPGRVPPNGWAAVRYGLGNSLLLLGMLTNAQIT